jgi:hypothetical protein
MVNFVMTVSTTRETRSFCSLLATEDHQVKLKVESNRFIFTTDRTDSRLVKDAMPPGSLSLLLIAYFELIDERAARFRRVFS